VTFFANKSDCLDLPPKVYEKLYCKMSKEQEHIYKELKSQMIANYEDKELTVTSKVVMALRLQMVTGGLFPFAETEIRLDRDGDEFLDSHFSYQYIEGSGKMSALLDDLECVPEDSFIIVWARFRGEIDAIHRKLTENGYTAEKYYGGSEYEVIERFKRGEFRILIGNPVKGGEGLNLQIATLHYYYSNSFRADSRLQSEDRSHRSGQTRSVTYKDLMVQGTIDERVYEVLKRKESLIAYFRKVGVKDIL